MRITRKRTASMKHERTTADNRSMTGAHATSSNGSLRNIAKSNGVTSDYLLGMLDELNRANAEATQNHGDIS